VTGQGVALEIGTRKARRSAFCPEPFPRPNLRFAACGKYRRTAGAVTVAVSVDVRFHRKVADRQKSANACAAWAGAILVSTKMSPVSPTTVEVLAGE
jgi:hypothetical protein